MEKSEVKVVFVDLQQIVDKPKRNMDVKKRIRKERKTMRRKKEKSRPGPRSSLFHTKTEVGFLGPILFFFFCQSQQNKQNDKETPTIPPLPIFFSLFFLFSHIMSFFFFFHFVFFFSRFSDAVVTAMNKKKRHQIFHQIPPLSLSLSLKTLPPSPIQKSVFVPRLPPCFGYGVPFVLNKK